MGRQDKNDWCCRKTHGRIRSDGKEIEYHSKNIHDQQDTTDTLTYARENREPDYLQKLYKSY